MTFGPADGTFALMTGRWDFRTFDDRTVSPVHLPEEAL
jgi:hypothetical protein